MLHQTKLSTALMRVVVCLWQTCQLQPVVEGRGTVAVEYRAVKEYALAWVLLLGRAVMAGDVVQQVFWMVVVQVAVLFCWSQYYQESISQQVVLEEHFWAAHPQSPLPSAQPVSFQRTA